MRNFFFNAAVATVALLAAAIVGGLGYLLYDEVARRASAHGGEWLLAGPLVAMAAIMAVGGIATVAVLIRDMCRGTPSPFNLG